MQSNHLYPSSGQLRFLLPLLMLALFFLGCTGIRKQTRRSFRGPHRLSASKTANSRSSYAGRSYRRNAPVRSTLIRLKGKELVQQIALDTRKKKAKLPIHIKEADLVKIKGDVLYYLHTTRGLLIIQFKNPKRPILLGRLPIYGTPVEMFVEDKDLYILANDILRLQQTRRGLFYRKIKKSQLIHVSIADPSNPKVKRNVDLPGRLKEGMARKKGDRIYLVANRGFMSRRYDARLKRYIPSRPRATLLMSYHVGGKGAIREETRLNLLPKKTSYNRMVNRYWVSRYWLSRTVLSATDDAIIAATHWRENSSLHGMSRSTKVEVFPLSHRGRLRGSAGSFWLPGLVLDQFKQHVYQEGNETYYLGVSSQNLWKRRGRTSWRHTRNTFSIYKMDGVHPPKRLSQIAFGKKNETVRGTAFDPQRRVLYAITALEKPPHKIIDPLYAISYVNPTQPKILSQIDELSGDMNLFRFIAGRSFLLAVGRDTSGECTGFGRGARRNRTAISIIDVRRLDSIRLVQRKCFSFAGARNTFSMVNQNRGQAHKMIGMASDGTSHFVTVPLFFTARTRTRYSYTTRTQSAVGLMQWDLRGYNPTKSEKHQNVLFQRGVVLHPFGRVHRTLLVKRRNKRLLLNFSRNYLSISHLPRNHRPSVLTGVSLPSAEHKSYQLKKHIVEQRSLQLVDKKIGLFKVYKRDKSGKKGALVSSRIIKNIDSVLPGREQFRVTTLARQKKIALRQNVISRYGKTRYIQDLIVSGKPLAMTKQTWPWEFAITQKIAKHSQTPYKPSEVLKVGGGLMVAEWRNYTLHGVSSSAHQLRWYRDFRSRKKQPRSFLLPQAQRYRMVALNSQSFFLHRNEGGNRFQYIQKWTLSSGRWKRSSWYPIPGLLGPVYASKKGVRMLIFCSMTRELMLFAWSGKKKPLKLIHKLKAPSSGFPTSYLLHKKMFLVNYYSFVLGVYLGNDLLEKSFSGNLPLRFKLTHAVGRRAFLSAGSGSMVLDFKEREAPQLSAHW